jgi:hypothetical protein
MSRTGVRKRRTSLVDEVDARVPQPVDALEIAAVIESMGVTDAVAKEDYAAVDGFDLAEHVFGAIRGRTHHPIEAGHATRTPGDADPAATTPVHDSSVRGLLAVAPLAIMLVTLQALVGAGWDASSVLALSLGVSAAMLLTNGPILAIARRASIDLGFGHVASARRFLVRASLAAFLACLAVDLAAFAAAGALGAFTSEERSIFAVSLAAFAALWLLAAGLSVVGASGAVVGALVVGLGLGIGVGAALGATVGLVVGYGVSLLALAAVGCVRLPAQRHSTLLPDAPGVDLLDALPYLLFGSTFALFLVAPHVIGWFGSGPVDTIVRVSTIEVSLLVALVPVVLAMGLGERTLRSFWRYAHDLTDHVAADGFRRGVRRYVLDGLVRYAAVLGALSLVTAVAFEALVAAGGVPGASQVVFFCGLVAFFLFGLGNYSCLFLLGLALPDRAVRPLAVGVLVVVVAGVPLTFLDFRLSALGFALGAGVFAAAATAACLTVLAEIPRRYSTAF